MARRPTEQAGPHSHICETCGKGEKCVERWCRYYGGEMGPSECSDCYDGPQDVDYDAVTIQETHEKARDQRDRGTY